RPDHQLRRPRQEPQQGPQHAARRRTSRPRSNHAGHRKFAQPPLRPRSRPAVELDPHDRRGRRARPGGDRARPDRNGLPDGEHRPVAGGAYVSRDQRAAADGAGLHSPDDRGRGSLADVTAEDEALVDRFLDMLAAEAGASPHTLAAYRNDLRRVAEAVQPLGAASADDLSRLGAEWAALAPATVARRAAALRRFFGFLVDDGLRKDDPSSALPRPRFERPLPRILDADEVQRMFEAGEDRAASGALAAVRNLALLELLYGSGLRATELVSLP